MLIEYALKDNCGRWIHRDIGGRFSYTTSEALADHYESRKVARNILENCLPRGMKKGFNVVELVVPEGGTNQVVHEAREMKQITPKVEEALKIANQPVIMNRIPEFAASVQNVAELLDGIDERKEELYNNLSAIDSEIADINHYIEFAEGLNAYQGYLAYCMLRQKLRQRRQIKDEIIIVKEICDSNISRTEFSRINSCIAGLDTRQYEPRALKELFT